jgi:hypothetical protein
MFLGPLGTVFCLPKLDSISCRVSNRPIGLSFVSIYTIGILNQLSNYGNRGLDGKWGVVLTDLANAVQEAALVSNVHGLGLPEGACPSNIDTTTSHGSKRLFNHCDPIAHIASKGNVSTISWRAGA